MLNSNDYLSTLPFPHQIILLGRILADFKKILGNSSGFIYSSLYRYPSFLEITDLDPH